MQTGLLDRFAHFYQKLDLITFLFSNRNLSAIAGMGSFSNEYATIEVFLGKGYRAFYEYADPVFGYGKITEIDFVDLVLMYGVIGTFVIFSFWFFLFIFSFYKVFSNRTFFYAPSIFLSNFMLIVASFTSGHIMYSGMAGIFFAFSNALLYSRKSSETL